jgi:hypothetical protein
MIDYQEIQNILGKHNVKPENILKIIIDISTLFKLSKDPVRFMTRWKSKNINSILILHYDSHFVEVFFNYIIIFFLA